MKFNSTERNGGAREEEKKKREQLHCESPERDFVALFKSRRVSLPREREREHMSADVEGRERNEAEGEERREEEKEILSCLLV